MDCPACHKSSNRPVGKKNDHDLFSCSGCGLIFVHPMPDAAELEAFYHGYHKTSQYTAKLDSKIRRAKKRIRSVKRHLHGNRFIDVGCNAGFAVEAARLLKLDACGIDIDPASIRFATKTFANCSFEVASAQNYAAANETFDLIYCSEVIEHLPNLDDFVVALLNMLKPEGIIFLTTPDIGHFSLNQKHLLDWDAVRPPEHLLHFNKRNLIQLFKHHGSRKIKIQWSFKPTIKAIIWGL